MDYTTLGNTGMRVSVAGLGCGGFSQLGLAQGKSEADAIAIIRQALELGVNLFDTAAAYGTEAVLGKAIKSMRREDVVICTKAPFSFSNPHSTPEGIVASLDKSLRQLDTDYIDVYQLHGVPPSAYDHALNDLAPVLLREKAKGKFRHLGITETAPHDPEHQVLHRAAQDGVWEVVDARVSHDASERPRPRLSADPRQPGRHVADVRGAQHLFAARTSAGHDARSRRNG